MDNQEQKTSSNNGASRFAFAIALGPVGRFISAGRRSRDLWYGSRLLSEMTRRAVLSLLEQEKERNRPIEFWTPRKARIEQFRGRPFLEPPRAEKGAPLEPHEGPVISNKILGILEGGSKDEVVDILRSAERDIRRFLVKQLDDLLDEIGDSFLSIAVDQHALVQQTEAILHGDFVEYYAAFARVGEGEGDTSAEIAALDRARRLLDGRKNARVFTAPSWTYPGRPRSNLEPGRDSVLVECDPARRADKSMEMIRRSRVGIRGGERLDAIGLLRRYAAMKEALGPDISNSHKMLPGMPFAPLARVAAHPWMCGVSSRESTKGHLERCRKELEALEASPHDNRPGALFLISSPSREPGKRVSRAGRRTDGVFPYDASLFFEGGVEAARRELQRYAQDLSGRSSSAGAASDAERERVLREVRKARGALDRLGRSIRAIHRIHGPPQPYYCMLAADGDGVGHFLSSLKSKDRHEARKLHEAFVGALDRFADGVWRDENIVRHDGFAFYVGGDEVMAWLPVDRALEAASALSALFAAEMTTARDACGASFEIPSLSIGLVIAHVKHDMRDVRRRAEAALRLAKEKRREAGRKTVGLHRELDDQQNDVKKQIADDGKISFSAPDDEHGGRSLAQSSWVCVNESPAGGTDRVSFGPLEEVVEILERLRVLMRDKDLGISLSHAVLADLARLDMDDKAGARAALIRILGGICLRFKRNDGTPDRVPAVIDRIAKRHYKLLEMCGDDAVEQCVRDLENLCFQILLAKRIESIREQRFERGPRDTGGIQHEGAASAEDER